MAVQQRTDVQSLLFGDCWERGTMMGEFLAQHVILPSGDIDPQLLDDLDKAEAVFVDLVATFIEANGGSLR